MTVLILLVAAVSNAYWLVGLLAIEFALRIVVGLGESPLGMLAVAIARMLKIPPKMVDAAPKGFAGVIALVFSLGAFVSGAVLGSHNAFMAFVVVFGTCAALESFAGVCLGCHIYSLLPARLVRQHRQVG